jgi:hypothetical protein
LFNICHFISGLTFKSKNSYITSQNCVYFVRENYQKLSQKRKWAFWIRQLALYLSSKFLKVGLCSFISW